MAAPEPSRPPWAGENYDWWQAMKPMRQRAYHCARVRPGAEPQLDGDVRSDAWSHAPWTDLFEDIQGQLQPAPRLGTRVGMAGGRRRLAQLHTQLGLTRMDAALLVLRHPRMLLPEAAEVVSFAVGRQCWWEQQQQQ